MSKRPVAPLGIEIAPVALAEGGRIGHEPARVDVSRDGSYLGADDRARDRAGGHRDGGGKFMQSTKMSSKSGCAASDTCSILRAMVAARARSGSDKRQSWAPRAAALPTYRIRPAGSAGMRPIRVALGIET